jgi:hypothetical protein
MSSAFSVDGGSAVEDTDLSVLDLGVSGAGALA